MLRSFAALLATLALAGSVSTAALAKKHHEDPMRGNSAMAPGHMKRMCPPGRHWVKPYRRKNGTWVQGYCR